MPRSIDLNSDLGEGYGPWRMGDDKAMLDLVTSANIACGGHAGDPETMFATLSLARDRGVVVAPIRATRTGKVSDGGSCRTAPLSASASLRRRSERYAAWLPLREQASPM